MYEKNICKFCNLILENLRCPKCGCLTPRRKVTNEDMNVTFTDYSYNRYQKGSLLSKGYSLWMRLSVYLFVKNTRLSQILNVIFSPLTGGKSGINFSEKENFIDVGSGRGDFMRNLPMDWNVQGCDIVDYGRSSKDIIIGNFERLTFKEQYSIVRAAHVLEHSLHPRAFLTKLVEITQRGGVVVISSPNPDSLAYRIFGKRWFPFSIESHFCILNIPAVSHYLLTHGCQILYTRTYTLFSSAGSLVNLLRIKRYSNIFFVFFALLLFPFTMLEFLLNKADSFIIYAKKI